MTIAEWRQIAGVVLSLWPHQPWPAATIQVGFELCRELPADATRRGIDRLAREGREFAPPPSVVRSYAAAEAAGTPMALPEHTPTADELAAERRNFRAFVAELAKHPIGGNLE